MKELFDSRYLEIDRFRVEKGSVSKHSLFFITEGEIAFSGEGQSGRALPGMLLSFPKETPFERRVLGHASFYYFRYLSDEEPMPLGMTAIENTGRMKATCEMILSLEKAGAHTRLKNDLFNDLFAQAEAERILIKPYKSGMVAEIRAFFDRHLDERISLERLAQSMRLSPSGLIHRFKKETGKTPMAYLSELRIAKAQSLLSSTDLSVSRIAALCGFESAYYFSNVFKATRGVSPRDYRKKQII